MGACNQVSRFGGLSVYTPVHPFTRPFTAPPFHAFVKFAGLLVCSFILCYVNFPSSLPSSLTRSLTHSFIHPSIHPPIHFFVHVYSTWVSECLSAGK